MLKRSRYYVLLGTLIAAGAVLRFYDLGTVSMTADELSALERLRFSSFGEMIGNGVRPDGHPAFVQALLWFWTKLFGLSELAVRFPFALASIISIWLGAAIARRWFGDACALMTAAVLACCEFPLMYGQLARPYAFGLFFSLALVFFWSRILFDEAKGRKPHVLILFSLSFAGALYTHYFSALFALIVALTGLFFITKTNWKAYVIAGAAGALLFIPHLGISADQLAKGGVGGADGWLAKPTPAFFKDHLAFIFNYSWIVGGAAVLAAGASVYFLIRNKTWNRFHLVAATWFLLPILIGYIYSVARNPVLQHSVLLFSMPFFLMLIFSGLREVHNSAGLIVIVFALVPPGSTVLEKQYSLENNFGRVKDLALNMREWSQRFGEKNITFTGNFDGEHFIAYYFDRLNWKPQMATTFNDGAAQLYDFRQLVQNSKSDYFSYVWSTRAPSIEILYLIREKYPYLVERNFYFNSESWLFSKKPVTTAQPNDTLFVAKESFEISPPKGWHDNLHTLTDSPAFEGKRALRLVKPDHVYGPIYSGKIGGIVKSPDDYITVEARVKADSGAAPVAVIEFKRGDSLIVWTGRSYDNVHHSFGSWERFFYGVRMYKELRSDDEIRIYFFNDRDAAAYIDDVTVRVIRNSRVIYGPQKDYAPAMEPLPY